MAENYNLLFLDEAVYRYQIIQLIKEDVEVFADVLSLDLHIFQFYPFSSTDIDALVLYSEALSIALYSWELVLFSIDSSTCLIFSTSFYWK